MAKKALVLLAGGFEEVEAVSPIDFLRRAGVEVTMVSIGDSKIVTGSHKIPLMADVLLKDLPAGVSWDALVMPGGMPGATNLAASAGVSALIKAVFAAGSLVAAICASPAVVLAPLGILKNRRYTCYPGMEAQVKDPGAQWSEDRVVIDGNLITSRGPGTAGEFAAAITAALVGDAERAKLIQATLMRN